MGRELEWKFSATKEDLEAVFAAFTLNWTQIEMETTYYDTPERILSHRKQTLRRRYENGHGVCTFKTTAQDGSRGEWECDASDIHAAIATLCALGAPEELRDICILEKVCAARFTRRAGILICPECTVELALDFGELHGGETTAPLCEIEVEYKSGNENAASAFAAAFAGRFALRAEHKSKYVRALALASAPDRKENP